MAWNHDLGVIEYLQKRLRYYKRLETRVANTIVVEVGKDNKVKFVVCKKWRGRFSVSHMRKVSTHYKNRVVEFENAIKLLNQSTETK